MEPASAEKLLKAFQILDSEGKYAVCSGKLYTLFEYACDKVMYISCNAIGKGTISKEYITKLMSEEGEPFTQASKCSFTKIKLKLIFMRWHF